MTYNLPFNITQLFLHRLSPCHYRHTVNLPIVLIIFFPSTMHLSVSYLLILSVAFGLWHVSQFIAAAQNCRRLAWQNGCQSPPRLPQMDKVLGSDVLLEEYRNFHNNSYLNMMMQRFELCGHTWTCATMGGTNLATTHIENIRTILVTKVSILWAQKDQKLSAGNNTWPWHLHIRGQWVAIFAIHESPWFSCLPC